MTRKLIQAELHPQPQDYKNIRIELPCLLMGDLFEKLFIGITYWQPALYFALWMIFFLL